MLIFIKNNVIIFIVTICAILFIENFSVFAQDGCKLIKKNEPVIFISFERLIEKDKKRIIQLRLNNNSTCTIVVPVKYEERRTANSESKACVPSTFGTLESNSNAFLFYEINDPRTNTRYFPYGGDVVGSASLKGGQSVLFEISVKDYKKGDFSLGFQYDWEVCNDRREMIILHHKLSFYSAELSKLIK
jgi:hypothetical protein